MFLLGKKRYKTLNTVNVSATDLSNHSVFVDFNRSLIGWWRFNNESGENNSQFRDWSSYGRNQTCSAPATCPAYNDSGRLGKGLMFNGTNYLDSGNPFTLTGSFSVRLWVKLNANSSWQVFVAKY